jgi:tetratricopeptide (TPR) repeat protein
MSGLLQGSTVGTGYEETDEKRKRQARARRLARRAEVLASEGRVDEAIVCQSALVDMRPDDAGAVLRLGLLYREARHIDAAVHAFRHAANLSPGFCDPREALIETLLDASQFDEAIVEGKELLRVAPRNVFARDVLSIAYLHIGKTDKALHMATEMTRLDPMNPNHHFKRALLLQQCGEIGGAFAEYARTRDLATPDSDIYADALDAIDALDDYQLHQILLLATEDWDFNHQLCLNAELAVQSRGFTLSEDAMDRAQGLAQDELQERVAGHTMLSAWGGVKFYN